MRSHIVLFLELISFNTIYCCQNLCKHYYDRPKTILEFGQRLTALKGCVGQNYYVTYRDLLYTVLDYLDKESKSSDAIKMLNIEYEYEITLISCSAC